MLDTGVEPRTRRSPRLVRWTATAAGWLAGAMTFCLTAALAVGGINGAAASPAPTNDQLSVVTSFYPLQFVAQQVGGDHVVVTNLTKPGAEPHDLELAPQDVATIADADLALYLSGFQPAVDDAIRNTTPGSALDVRNAARLTLSYTPVENGQQAQEQEQATDPHFWLDPLRLADVADAVATKLGALDPAHADDYLRRAQELRTRLVHLDTQYRQGLAHCQSTTIVTSHNAFGYLAQAYGLRQIGITGLTPDSEPDPRSLAAITDFVRRNDIHTIYYETLVSPAIAQTVADATGAQTAVLDPIEGLTTSSAGRNYFQIMQSNLASLESGLSCQ